MKSPTGIVKKRPVLAIVGAAAFGAIFLAGVFAGVRAWLRSKVSTTP